MGGGGPDTNRKKKKGAKNKSEKETHNVSAERRVQRVFTRRCKHPDTPYSGPAAPQALPGSVSLRNCSIKESLEADIGPSSGTGDAKKHGEPPAEEGKGNGRGGGEAK